MEEQKKRLLSEEESHGNDGYPEERTGLKQQPRRRTSLKDRCRLFYVLILHISIVGLLVFICKDGRQARFTLDSEIYSPAHDHLSYVVNNDRQKGEPPHSPYTGYPNAKNNRAWESLIEPIFFNATTEELTAAGTPIESAVKLAKGGYVGSLAVYHELHCLRRLRLHLYKEVYFPNITAEEQEHDRQHLDHCIETLRQSAMCRADQGVYTFFWSPEYPNAEKPLTRSDSPRKCVDWSAFEKWTRQRMISLHPLLMKPTGEFFSYGGT